MTAQTVTQAVATRDAGIVSVMWGRKTHLAAILPDHIDVKSFLGTAAAALYANADLMKCAERNPDSLIRALMRCAALGHQPGTDEFYLTPRGLRGGKRGPEVVGIEGYRGIVERMYRSGGVRSVIVREVCAKDQFRYVEGSDDRPVHSFGTDGMAGGSGADFFGPHGHVDRGEMVGVYAYAMLATGAVSRVVILNRDDVEAARDSGGYRPDDEHSPWNRLDAGKDHPELTGRAQWWKTAARRLEPWVPTSAEYRREQLRAAAEIAQSVNAAAPAVAPAANGHAEPVYEAEIVEDAPPAETASDQIAKRPASKAALERLDKLVRMIDLGPDDDVRAAFEWLTGEPWTATRSQVDQAHKWLDDHLQAAGGDVVAAATNAWNQYLEANPQAGDDSA